MSSGLTHRLNVPVQHRQELQRVQFLALETHGDMQLVAAQGHRLPGFHTLAELGEDIGQVSVGHLILPVADGLADAVSAIIAHTRHDAAGKGGKRIAPHVEVDAVMKEFLARRRVGLFAVAERQLHVLALLFLERHTIAALGLQDHFFCIFHAVSILIRILSSHSSMCLFPCRKVRCTGALHVFCLRRAEDTSIVADEHHAEKCAGNLAQPAEASEYEERRRNQSGNTQSGDVAAAKVAEKVAEHIKTSATGGLSQKVRHAVQFVVDAGYRTTDRTDGFSCLARQFTHAVRRACNGIRDGFAHNGIAHDTHHAFVGGQLLPAHITDRAADGRRLDGLTRATQGLRRVQHRFPHTFAGSRRCRTDTFCGLAAIFQ